MSTGTLLESLGLKRTQQRKTAWQRYRELLDRNDKPKAGDADALAEVLRELEFTDADVAADLKRLARARTHEATVRARAQDEPEKTCAAMERQATELAEEIGRLEKKREAVIEQWQRADIAAGGLLNAQTQLNEVRAERPELFGMEPPRKVERVEKSDLQLRAEQAVYGADPTDTPDRRPFAERVADKMRQMRRTALVNEGYSGDDLAVKQAQTLSPVGL